MKPAAYIETSVVSYLTARPSRDVVVAAYQEVTREWWRDAPDRFDLVASELVVTESGAGDTDAARARLEMLESVTLLNVNEETEELTLRLLPDPGPGAKLNAALEGRDDKADEAAIFAGIQGTVGCPAVAAGCDA